MADFFNKTNRFAQNDLTQIANRNALVNSSTIAFNPTPHIMGHFGYDFMGQTSLRRPNQQCDSTEGQWLINCVKGQSHRAQLTNRQSKECSNIVLKIYSTMKTKDTEVLGRQSNKKTKQDQSPIQSTNLQELLVPLCTIVTVDNTVAQRQFC